MNRMKVCLIMLFLLAPALAGVGITPATGTYTFDKAGGTLIYQVINTEKAEAQVNYLLSGEGEKYASLTKQSDTYAAGEVKSVAVTFRPGLVGTEYNKPYEFVFTAQLIPKSTAQGSGVTFIPNAVSAVKIIFEDSTKPKPQVTPAAATPITFNPIWLVVGGAVVLLIATAMFILRGKR